MTPLFTIFMQHEITAMQFHPLSRNLLICGTASGQVLLINLLKNFYEILQERYENRGFKIHSTNIPYEVKTSFFDKSHRTPIRALEFVPKE